MLSGYWIAPVRHCSRKQRIFRKLQIAVEEQLSPATPAVGSQRSRGFLRVVFSFPVVRMTLLTVLTLLTVRSRFNDSDLWWHLKTGEIIWKTHSIPRVDLFSFT